MEVGKELKNSKIDQKSVRELGKKKLVSRKARPSMEKGFSKKQIKGKRPGRRATEGMTEKTAMTKGAANDQGFGPKNEPRRKLLYEKICETGRQKSWEP